MQFIKDVSNKKVTIIRNFQAPKDLVWKAWTESELLDQWWAPKPWRAETKSLTFAVGGSWIYAMVGPENEKHWAKMDYLEIYPTTQFISEDYFCDEHGNKTNDLPVMLWNNQFTFSNNETTVTVEITFNELADLQKIVEMGFEEGFTAALENLDHYFETQFKMRKGNKKSNLPRVSTYLNFPGKTEEAFLFYKKVFRGEFVGSGLQRFGDIEFPPETPPLSDADKNLIIHAELKIMGEFILMATDAPESMGFTVKEGNNMHINLEPDSKEEAKRLFDELSQGGKISMPMTDMFWGAYYGSLTDKFGINWMINYQQV